MKARFTDEQIIAMIKEQESGEKTADVCRRHGISSATFYKYKSKYGGMEPSDAKRLRALEDENGKLKSCWQSKCSTMRCCEISIQKNGDARWKAESCGASDGSPSSQSAAGV
ncbi:transposase [Planktotalea lamellibrachiae]|nr:transposase [Aliiroseovarius lamellibrachiae]